MLSDTNTTCSCGGQGGGFCPVHAFYVETLVNDKVKAACWICGGR